MVVNALAMILTFFIMAPIMQESWQTLNENQQARAQNGQVANQPAAGQNQNMLGLETDVLAKAAEPFRVWLSNHTADRERAFFINTAERLWGKDGEPAVIDSESFYILIPSFCVSELTKAFQIGFLVYLPFIAIDIIVSNILLAMGMMMVSPVTISLPFKLLLFVMVDGWTLLIQGLIRGYVL
jgi:type III secretion protein R